MSELVFLHVSDIHLREEELDSGIELDLDIRDELARDLRTLRGEAFDSLDGVLLTGDVAFAGKAKEYESAWSWLEKLRAEFGFPEGAVWCVPGNHDVDQSIIAKSPQAQWVRERVRSANEEGAALTLHELLKDQAAHMTLLGPMHQYNARFANRVQCQTSCPTLVWTDRVALANGYEVVLYGLNSVAISDASDELPDARLVVGLSQLQAVKRRPGAINVSLCHHPPKWLLDHEAVAAYLNTRTTLQLYGHEHEHSIRQLGHTVHVFAGALHPRRREAPWRPHYNVISLSLSSATPPHRLVVQIWARAWDEAATEFRPVDAGRDEPSERFVLPLPSSIDSLDLDEAASAEAPKGGADGEGWERGEATGMISALEALPVARDVVTRFFLLSWVDRMRIAMRLELCEDGDVDVDEGEFGRRVFLRASRLEKLKELTEAIDSRLAELQARGGH